MREMDYSVIDEGEGGARNEGFIQQDVDTKDWNMPEQGKVSVHLNPNLEGSLLQKHHVWIVVSNNAKSSTERRYSDFVWLLDCLQKRYPFRLLPSLPPKSIQYQGHFIGQDEGFLDRRKKGLERCLNVLINHPVIKLDGILASFLNEPNDLSATRKQSNLSLAEESTTFTLSSSQLASLPPDLEARLTTLRQRLPIQIETWTKLSITADRLAHRRLNQSQEWSKFSEGLEGAVKLEEEGMEWRPREMRKTEREIRDLGKTSKEVAGREEESAKRALEGWVEDVKRHRELYTNLRDLFHRQQTLGIDQLDKLLKRLSSNTSKLELLQSTTPPPPSYALDYEKLSTSIETDKRLIEGLKRRREFIKWCVWQELQWFFRSTSLLRENMKGFARSERGFARSLESVWSALEEGLGDDA